MKKTVNINFKSVTIVLLSATVTLTAIAQKLPNIQKNSLRAPANISIDGKTTEWNNQLQAYNHATDIFYTVANDDRNLYLAIQATNPTIINKIIGGGITFTIQTSNKKTDKDGMSITYPIFDPKKRPYINKEHEPNQLSAAIVDGQVMLSGSKDGQMVLQNNKPINKVDIKTIEQRDSAMKVNNKRIGESSKFIRVNGIKDMDSLISVYNQDGIKTAQLFDNNLAYNYELAIDLKKIGLSINNSTKFNYHIKLNGVPATVMHVNIAGGPTMDAVSKSDATAASPTDFWGEYILAKK